MAQHDYAIADQSGLSFLSDLNSALAAIVSNNSGATAPSTTYAYQYWMDTTTGNLKQRNAANNAWVTIAAFLTELSTKAYVDALLAAQDAMVFKGVINCSANPNYPAADAGHVYKVSVAGKIGGASGPNVEAGDTLYCITDSTASGTQAGVGANWVIIQTNIDGAVVGPASVTDSHFAQFDGTTGKLIKGGLSLDTDGTLAANSDTRVASQKAIKTYADASKIGVDLGSFTVSVAQASIIIASSVGDLVASFAAYSRVEFEFIQVRPATNGTTMRASYYTDGGTTPVSSNTYGWGVKDWGSNAAEALGQSNLDSVLRFGNSAPGIDSSTSRIGVNGKLILRNPAASCHKALRWDFETPDSGSADDTVRVDGHGSFRTTTAVNGLKIFFVTGNVAVGSKIKVTGYL